MGQRKFVRVRKGKMILGLCGGLAKYWGQDPALVRFFWLAFTLLLTGYSPGMGFLWILLYFLSPLFIPAGDESAP